MRRLKIGIRTQLIVLVTFACLFSLLILAIVCGVYFSANLTNLRAERLEVISQLKSSQVTQSIDYLFYQVYYLTTRDSITNPLTSYRAGNNSQSVFDEAQLSLDQFVSNSESFSAARLYNLDLKVVAESQNNATRVSTPTTDYLYPLQQNVSIPSEIIQLNNQIDSFYFSGPVSNTSDPYSTYFIGITYAVYANTSILLSSPSIAGYLSVITSADNIQQAVNNSNSNIGSSQNTTGDYTVIAYEPVFESNNTDDTSSAEDQILVGFQAVFPVTDDQILSNTVYTINQSSAAQEALTNDFGSSTNKKDVNGNSVAIGYSKVQLDANTYWSIVISQKKSTFNAPLTKFKNIIIGVAIGIGAFVCLITFPLAVLFIRPITRLKDATEAITRSKREKELATYHDILSENALNSENSQNSPPPPYYSTLIRRRNVEKGKSENGEDKPGKPKSKNKRNSVLSAGTGGSNSLYSTGIRLPSKITQDRSFFKDELTELTEAFNIMREELEKQYVHLEDRVKLRTKELEASKIEAEAANEAKTVFIANISHELRTPLNGILGMTSIAMEENDVGTIKDSLKLINRSGELLLHILTELLTYSKNTLNRSKLEKSSFQILEIVYQVQSIFNKLAHDQRVYFKILVKPNSFRKLILYGDSNRIIQVVMNLVSNALKFTPVEGRVDVNFKLLGEYDAKRSKADDYEQVHVIHYDGQRTNVDTTADTDDFKDAHDTIPPHELNSNNVAESSEDIQADANDNSSLFTLTTQEYDNVLFQSQFIQNSKPLPQLPEVSDDSNENTQETVTEDDEGDDDETDNENEPLIKLDQPVIKPGANKLTPKSSKNSQVAVSPFEDPANIVHETPKKYPESYELSNLSKVETKSGSSTARSGSSTAKSAVIEGKPGGLAKAKPLPKLLPPPNMRDNFIGSTTGTSTTKRPSVNSMDSLNSNELVKNDKVYKIKNLYKPKTWVLQIEVSDTGPGIEPALHEKVFEPFIQGDQTLSRSYGGTGLGLAICRQLAKMMKGTMTLKSTLGVGSTFVFTVPLPQVGEILVPEDDMDDFCEDEFNSKAKANRKVAFRVDSDEVINPPYPISSSSPNEIVNGNKDTEDNKPPYPVFAIDKAKQQGENQEPKKKPHPFFDKPFLEKPRLVTRTSTATATSSNASGSERLETGPSHFLLDELSHLKILVAEDNMVNQEVIKRMLSLEGFTNVTMASNGAEAVDNVKEAIEQGYSYDLIFMDVQMPKIDGLLATKMIRNNLNYENPIIALTAFADESNVKECLNSGMSGFLSKPIRRTNLRKIITEFSPVLLSDVVTTPNTQGEEKRLGFNTNFSNPNFTPSKS